MGESVDHSRCCNKALDVGSKGDRGRSARSSVYGSVARLAVTTLDSVFDDGGSDYRRDVVDVFDDGAAISNRMTLWALLE